MERRVLKLCGRSCGDSMEEVMGMAWKERYGRSYRDGMVGAVWKVLEGMVDMDGMEGMDGIPCKDTTFL